VKHPSPNGPDGRDARGRFARGNPGGPGNPHARRVAQLRAALLKAVKPADVQEVARRLVSAAKAGDVPAAKLLLDRLFGPPVAVDVEERLEKLENALRKEGGRWVGRID